MDSENPIAGGSAQSTDQLDWLAHFQSQTQDLDIKAGNYEENPSCPDEVQIQIEDLGTKLSALEAQLVEKHTKNGGITVDECREMKDLIVKYSPKLNSIDFMGRTDALTGLRTELLDIILKIQKKLEDLTKIETQSLSQRLLVVEVTEGKLTINESASKSLLQLCSQNNYSGKYGISLVSIVGDRKSGKSRLFESIQKHAVGSEWKVLTPPGGTLECSGISCCVLCVDEKEKRRLIFLMDIICDESCNSEIYTKLVDFCILTSDVVFYTEKEELDLVDPRNPCHWDVDSSICATLPQPIRNTLNRPHVFVLTRDLEYLYLQETPLLEFMSNRIRQQESDNAASPSYSPQNQGSPLEAKNTKHAPSTSSILTQKQNPITTSGAKSSNEKLWDFFQNTLFFQNVAGNDLGFGAVADIGKLFEEISELIERESASSTDRCPSTLQHSAEEDAASASLSLAFHLTPSSLQAAVFIPGPDHNAQSESNSPVFTHHWPPCILFQAGDIGLVGNEAQISPRDSSGSCFNVYSLLQRGTQGSYTVKMNEAEETLKGEEILATFLFKIKRQIEAELNTNLTSATFAMCSHFSITARHMVKTSLSLAGFQKSVLVHSKVAASVAELVKPRNFGERHSSVLLLHDEQEITQLCIQGAAPSFKVDAFDNLTNTKKSVTSIQRQVILNSCKLTYCPTSVIIMRMSPLVLSKESPSPTERLLTTALTDLQKSDPGFENCEIRIKNVDECDILLGAHLYSSRISDGMKKLSKNKDKCAVFGEMKKGRGIRRFFGPLSVSRCKFTDDLDFFNRTKKHRNVLNVKMRGTDKLWICDKGVAGCGARSVAALTRRNQNDRKEMEIRIYYSSEGLLDFQLKSQNERVEDAVAIKTDYLLPQQVEAAKVKLSRYLKTNYEIKIEDSWKTFVKNTDSMSIRDEGNGERSDFENSHFPSVVS